MSERTFLDALIDALDSARRATGGGSFRAPAALLWPDENAEWRPLIEQVAARLPVLVLDAFDSQRRQGPAYWLRCVVDGSIAIDGLNDGAPVIYLPGHGRAELRAIEESPAEIQPIADLQYRGAVFTQVNGKDWTIPAFLQSTSYGGLGVEVGADGATRTAIRQACHKLGGVRLATLRASAPLRAAFFNELLTPDLPRLILEWLDDPAAFRATCSEAEWEAFRQQFRDVYRRDLVDDGPVKVAEYLGQRPDDGWATVWRRFTEAPALYGNLPDRLRGARPTPSKKGPGFFDRLDSWPQVNDEQEGALRTALAELSAGGSVEARARILDLEQQHRDRRGWVWTHLGRAPLALALEHLAQLARLTAHVPAGESAQSMAAAYASEGWRVDDAVVRALAEVSTTEDIAAVESAVLAVYGSWLDEAARAFQRVAHTYNAAPLPPWAEGTCVVFSDGLRYDVARRLEDALVARGLAVEGRVRLTALPSVTATAKPFATPVWEKLGPGPDMDAAVAGGSRFTQEVLRRQLAGIGWQTLGPGEFGNPTGSAWTELGDIDSLGHDQTAKLPRLLDEEVAGLADRARDLLAAGWARVVIVTDHGWLYLPGGLPKVDLPQHLTVGGHNRKARCGRLDQGATTSLPVVPWMWDPTVAIAVAPGSAAFESGQVYEHGGVSLQECVTPLLIVTAAAMRAEPAPLSISVRWRGLRAVVTVPQAPAGASLDLRGKAGDQASSVVESPAQIGSDGTAALLVEDEDLEGRMVFAVVLDATGTPVGQRAVEVGADT